MTRLKERNVAIPLTIVVCIIFLLLGVRTGLQRAASDLTEMYETGVDGSGYGIATDLQKRYTYSGNLTAVAQKYDAAFETEISAVSAARADLDAALATDSFADDYDANAALTEAVEALNLAMKSYDLSDEDEAYRAEIYADLISRNDTISHEATDFNAEVRSFNEDVLGAFPASLLHGLVGVDAVEVYG